MSKRARTRGPVVEVVATWGTGADACVLAVAYVPVGEGFTVGKGGPYDLALSPEVMGEVTLRERVVEDEPWRVAAVGPQRWLPPRELIASALAHLVVLLVAALARPSDAAISPDQIATMRQLLAASAEPQPDERVQAAAMLGTSRHERPSASRPRPEPATRSASVVAPAAVASSPAVTSTVSAPATNRAAARAEASTFGMISLVQALAIPPNEPSAWSDKTAALATSEAHLHSMFDDDAIGGPRAAALAENAVQGGGGVKGAGVDLGPLDLSALPPPPPRPLPARRSSIASLHPHSVALLMAGFGEDVIRRVVHANAGRIRQCYQRSLRANPTLSGRVVVAFTIGPTGAVTAARDDGGDLDDAPARACIVKGFYALMFPPPASGHVDITYPFVLSPNE